jgi:uncharacterized membrane protein YcfT
MAGRFAGADGGADERRVPWVDTAKGVCIVLVVMMHATLGVGEAMGGQGFMHWVVAFAKPFRMPDFFLVSGLFLSRASTATGALMPTSVSCTSPISTCSGS